MLVLTKRSYVRQCVRNSWGTPKINIFITSCYLSDFFRLKLCLYHEMLIKSSTFIGMNVIFLVKINGNKVYIEQPFDPSFKN